MRAAFRPDLPERCNIAWEAVGRHAAADPERVALVHLHADGRVERWRFGALDRAAARLANVLAAAGVGRGDRVAVLLPQSPPTLIAHLAAWRLGAVSVPLFTLFGAEGVAFRMADSGATALVTDAANRPKAEGATGLVLTVGGAGAEDFDAALARAADACAWTPTGPDDPALICYTSGTTGAPKGALHGHRVLAGHMAGFVLSQDFPVAPAMVWTPADWAWMGGLFNTLLPALTLGLTALSHRMERFDPERAFKVMADHGVTNLFAPPTALRLLRQVAAPRRFDLALRAAGCAGEPMGAELLEWGRNTLGLTINEFYGQTECNMAVGASVRCASASPGSMGRPMPGVDVAVLDTDGRALGPGAQGEIALKRGAASMFLGYWGQPAMTAERFSGDWLRTGDEARWDESGQLWFAGRTDDVITSSGYRIGPSEIEDCLIAHPAVAQAAAVGEPDPVRTEAVVAHVVLREGAAVAPEALIEHVRARLGAHMAPRRVVFREGLPTTATGKIKRRELRGPLTPPRAPAG